jgi:hypothetical protein
MTLKLRLIEENVKAFDNFRTNDLIMFVKKKKKFRLLDHKFFERLLQASYRLIHITFRP